MSTLIATVPAATTATERIPPLENGDQLTRDEFDRGTPPCRN